MWWIPGLVWLAIFVVMVLRDARRMRCAVALLASLLSFGFAALATVAASLPADNAGGWILLGLVLLAILVVVVLGVVLVLNGFVMIRKEGRRLANLLGLMLGLVMLGYVGWAVAAVVVDSAQSIIWLAFIGGPLAWLGFGFSAYLLYSWAYLWATRRWAKPPVAVVVLGSGLIRGQVPPLLASRLDAGLALARRGSTTDPLKLVVSGGRGSDESRSEASAMAEYLVKHGCDPANIIVEDQSHTTAQNIANTQQMLRQAAIGGRVGVVTNNFHAFRAATLMSRQRLPGYALGSPTAHYYWPAATIREYVAILRDSAVFTIVCLALTASPLIIRLISLLVV